MNMLMLKYEKCQFNIKNSSFTMRVFECRNRLPKRSGRVSILGDAQDPTGHGPGQPAIPDPALTVGWTG